MGSSVSSFKDGLKHFQNII